MKRYKYNRQRSKVFDPAPVRITKKFKEWSMSFGRKTLNISALKDLHLAWRAKEGDSDAYAKLYIKYLNGIYRYVYFRVGGDNDFAEDIAQETFLKSWEKIKDFSFKKGTFQAWIYKIAKNLTTDELRKNGRIVKLENSYADSGNDLAETLDAKLKVKNLIIEVNKLTDIQKQVTTLRFMNGLNTEETAKILGKSREAIRAIQYRALKILKRKLKK